ncbi:MAG: TetR family transcriptional regulator C-terminal domain-containing protein [Clostridiales bacterium]|jgi:AcrR family transcriptional regulator|nr:TetR family transcriptional regulator C-terminal domain-containing protein [Clostridiales bacterium]
MGKSDRRTKYTKSVLVSSFFTLLKQKPVNKITVTELCELADVNRGTFYLHYYDVYDLLEQVENELFDKVKKSLQTTFKSASLSDFMMEIIFAITENAELCKALFIRSDSGLIKRILDLAREICIDDIVKNRSLADEREIDYVCAFIFNGSLSVLRKWAESDFKEPPKTIADIILKLSRPD